MSISLLANGLVECRWSRNGKSFARTFTVERFKSEFGFTPVQFIRLACGM